MVAFPTPARSATSSMRRSRTPCSAISSSAAARIARSARRSRGLPIERGVAATFAIFTLPELAGLVKITVARLRNQRVSLASGRPDDPVPPASAAERTAHGRCARHSQGTSLESAPSAGTNYCTAEVSGRALARSSRSSSSSIGAARTPSTHTPPPGESGRHPVQRAHRRGVRRSSLRTSPLTVVRTTHLDEFDTNAARDPLVASVRDEPPRDGERCAGQYEPRQTEKQIRRHGAVPVAEQVLQRAPRHEGCPAAEQDQDYGRDNTHCTMYTLNRLPVAESRQTNNTSALRQKQRCGRGAPRRPQWTRCRSAAH